VNGVLGAHGANVTAKEPSHVYADVTTRNQNMAANIAEVRLLKPWNATDQTNATVWIFFCFIFTINVYMG
jgi:hypothetical protein